MLQGLSTLPDFSDFSCHDPSDTRITRTHDVLRNLVLNARDATPTGGRLIFATANVLEGAHQGDSKSLTISDTGRGMDEESLSHPLDPFFTTKQERKGTGLGLSKAYGFVKQSGETISCDSRLGEGTTFRILLSREDAGEVTPVEAEPRKVEVRRDGTILIAEDAQAVRSFISRTLSVAGYAVTEAKNGTDALEALRAHSYPIDLILSDVVMPLLGGLEL